MTSALDAVLAGLFDYAGMFPPSSLSLEDALQASASFPKSLKRPGILGADIVVGAEGLRGLQPSALARAGYPADRPLRACLIGAPMKSAGQDFSEEAGRVRAFNGAGDGEAALRRVVSFEFKMEIAGRAHREGLKTALAGLTEFPSDVLVFVEPDLSGPGYPDALRELCAALADLNGSGGVRVGLKVRCGGAGAADAPRMARAIIEVCRRGLPFKATAGLHHPLPEKERYGNELGFLNTLAALLLARDLGLGVFPEEAALACLRAVKAEDFRFSEGLSWGRYSVNLERALDAKAQAHFSIGSCSLSEPDEDLVRLFGEPQ